jgi:hypothetical protein
MEPMRTLFFALFVAASLMSPVAAQSIGGTYSVIGKNFDGSPYAGTVRITASGSTCRIVWQTGSTAEGMCMLSGKTLAAFYRIGPDFGLAIYELEPDGSLTGRWGLADKEGVGLEVLTPQK